MTESGEVIAYTVKENGVNGNNEIVLNGNVFKSDVDYDNNGNATITNTYTKLKTATIKVTVSKKWVDGEGKSAKFKIVSIGNNTGIADEEITLTPNTWDKTVSLREYNDDGTLAEYQVTEEGIRGYVSTPANGVTVTKDGDKSEFTNTRVMKTLTIEKKWIGLPAEGTAVTFTVVPNPDGIEFKLTKDNELQGPTGTVWTREFTTDPLPEYRADGSKIIYKIKEMDGLDDSENPVESGKTVKLGNRTYRVECTNEGNTFNFTNTDVTEGTIEVTKTWKGQVLEDAEFGLFRKTASGELEKTNYNVVDTDDDTEDEADTEDDDENGFVEVDDDVDIDDDSTPQGSVEIEEDGTPQGNATLPKTGGTPVDFLGIIGMGLMGLGLVFKKKRH